MKSWPVQYWVECEANRRIAHPISSHEFLRRGSKSNFDVVALDSKGVHIYDCSMFLKITSHFFTLDFWSLINYIFFNPFIIQIINFSGVFWFWFPLKVNLLFWSLYKKWDKVFTKHHLSYLIKSKYKYLINDYLS